MPRILIVDDEPRVRDLARRILELGGYETEEATDARDALRKFRARPADLVLCDLFMPMGDGLEVLRDSPKTFAGVAFVAMSGGGYRGMLDMLPTARRLGAVAVLAKPFHAHELLAIVATQLAVSC